MPSYRNTYMSPTNAIKTPYWLHITPLITFFSSQCCSLKSSSLSSLFLFFFLLMQNLTENPPPPSTSSRLTSSPLSYLFQLAADFFLGPLVRSALMFLSFGFFFSSLMMFSQCLCVLCTILGSSIIRCVCCLTS